MIENDSDETKLQLSEDIKSMCNPDVVYGLTGEGVSIISVHGNVSIVQNESGNRFSVPNEKLSGNIVQTQTAAPADAVQNKTNTNREPAAKKIKAAPINQNTLF